MRRFFYYHQEANNPLKQLALGTQFTLPEEIVHHWCRVLRAKVGEQGILFDGFGGECVVELVEIGKKQAIAQLLQQDNLERTSPINTHMGLVISRGERMDYAIQKATELGITSIQLLTSHHSEVYLKANQVEKKLNHWQQVAISACEQCGLNRPPIIFAPLSIENWLNDISQQPTLIINPQLSDPTSNIPLSMLSIQNLLQDEYYQQRLYKPQNICRLVLAVPEKTEQNQYNNQYPAIPSNIIQQLKQSIVNIQLLIGAEGGLSKQELEQAQNTGFTAWQIGERVLRTETAPVVALSSLQTIHTMLSSIPHSQLK